MQLIRDVIKTCLMFGFLLYGNVQCIANSNRNVNGKLITPSQGKDLKVEESRGHEPAELYKGSSTISASDYRDRYQSVSPEIYGDRGDFVTTNSNYPFTSTSYGTYGINKDRYNSFGVSGIGGGGYTGGYAGGYGGYGGYDKRPPYGPPQTINYAPSSGGYDNTEQGHGYDYGYQAYPQHHGKEITKSILIPLAGAALLGVAAAFIANPVLLHLGTIAGKRKRRDISTKSSHPLAYRGHLYMKDKI